jgi:hypothetical protein
VEFLLLCLLGLGAGVLAGLLGIGGGIIFTPVLYFLFENAGIEQSVQWSVASGMFCTLIAASSSAFRQFVQNNIFLKESLLLGVLGALGISVGKLILVSPYYNRTEFVIFFSMMLLYASFMMFRRGRDKAPEIERIYKPIGFKTALMTGGIGGMVASLAGVGGGGVMVPIMNLFYKQPFRKCVSVSQLGMTLMLFLGVIQMMNLETASTGISNFTIGFIDFGTVLPLSIGGLFGGFAGAFLNHKIRRDALQWIFAGLAIVMASRLIWSIL